jgi:hypothetical protein
MFYKKTTSCGYDEIEQSKVVQRLTKQSRSGQDKHMGVAYLDGVGLVQ